MAILHNNGFGALGVVGGAPTHLANFYSTATSSFTLAAHPSGSGVTLESTAADQQLIRDQGANYTTLVQGCRYYSTSTATNQVLAQFYDSANALQCTVNANGTTGELVFRRGGSTGTVVATSSAGVWTSGQDDYWETKVNFSNTGSFEVRRNGVNVFSGSGDTTQTANQNGRRCAWFFRTSGTRMSDIYLDDSDFRFVVGTDLRSETKLPRLDGTLTQWTTGPTSGVTPQYTMIDEVPHDSSTTYLEGFGASGIVSRFLHQTVGGGDTVLAVGQTCIAGFAGTLYLTRRIGGVDYSSSSFVLDLSYGVAGGRMNTSPATGLAWTPSEVNAAEFGISKEGAGSPRVTLHWLEVLVVKGAAPTFNPAWAANSNVILGGGRL